MRLSQFEIQAIITAFKQHYSDQDHIYLFGSRLDDNKRGGDIDLYIESANTNAKLEELINTKVRFMTDLQCKIGEQKIDVIINANNDTDSSICQHARQTGEKLI